MVRNIPSEKIPSERKKKAGGGPSGSSRTSVRTVTAVAVCKTARKLLNILGGGGTALPGRLAMGIRADLLKDVTDGMEVVLVTGTNGKTTTAAMLADGMRRAGRTVAANRSGANLVYGVTAEFAAAADMRGRPTRRYAVIECDEGALRRVASMVRPRVIAVTNLFRDQLDRYGEVMHTLEVVREGIRTTPDAILCLNADDSLTASLAMDLPNRVVWFGMEAGAGQTQGGGAETSDARYCIRCGAEYKYRYRTYAHLGGFSCPSCGYSRPDPDVAVTSIDRLDADGTTVQIRSRENGDISIRIALPALYNIYNAAAALGVYRALGLPQGEIIDALAGVETSFGRMETFRIGQVPIRMILVKNPAGCNQALDYVCSYKRPCSLVLGLNDLDADGHDISWIWDADYEKLCGPDHICRIFVWGRRADDLRLRLKYAGLEEKRIRLFRYRSVRTLLDCVYRSPVPVFVLPNYTTMLPLREALRRAAGKESFWKS